MDKVQVFSRPSPAIGLHLLVQLGSIFWFSSPAPSLFSSLPFLLFLLFPLFFHLSSLIVALLPIHLPFPH
jgi:hypothetical protein